MVVYSLTLSIPRYLNPFIRAALYFVENKQLSIVAAGNVVAWFEIGGFAGTSLAGNSSFFMSIPERIVTNEHVLV